MSVWSIAVRLSSLFDSSSLGSGYWLGLFGFLAAALVEVVNLTALRHRKEWEPGDQLR